jgi:hypothetical protein
MAAMLKHVFLETILEIANTIPMHSREGTIIIINTSILKAP